MAAFKIEPVRSADRKWIHAFIKDRWSDHFVVSRGKIHYPEELSGFIAKIAGNYSGLVTFRIDSGECEIVTLDSCVENIGIGTALIHRVIETARAKKCSRIWLITTNDNKRAIEFYKKRGFGMVALYRDAVLAARKLKPSIPEFSDEGLPIKDEIEFEYSL
jgi:ribosomal protein S18 acetylase RimI-like enzyme